MAIAAVALVSLIGLIPQGLKTMRDASDQAIQARIHQQILSEMQLTPFKDKSGNPNIKSSSPLKTFHKQIRLYDAQGVELGYKNEAGSFVKGPSSVSDSDAEFSWVYSARIWLPFFENGGTPDSVGTNSVWGGGYEESDPDSKNADYVPNFLTVIIETVPFQFPGDGFSGRLGNAESFLKNPENFNNIHTFQTAIARMGMDYTP